MGEENVQVGGMEVNSFYFPGHIRPHEEVSKYKISLSPQITQWRLPRAWVQTLPIYSFSFLTKNGFALQGPSCLKVQHLPLEAVSSANCSGAWWDWHDGKGPSLLQSHTHSWAWIGASSRMAWAHPWFHPPERFCGVATDHTIVSLPRKTMCLRAKLCSWDTMIWPRGCQLLVLSPLGY